MDSLLAMLFLREYWNYTGSLDFGMERTVRRVGLKNVSLFNITRALLVQWDAISTRLEQRTSVGSHSFVSRQFVDSVWGALQDLEYSELDEISDDAALLALWANVFELHHIRQ
ncbi:hypothetical protein SCHPADRAFT_903385 [Schizopora paradoxa]|uniref:Uncharacterized protein n=1 Tax=Schizopora paradoxa TaxID=27342 RepID=A0A0H2SBP5_9AGAM|nr:hypothetical protein SCHPADRAFT_903385 [Schizopora paradoxa]